jgi:hypothetical protein
MASTVTAILQLPPLTKQSMSLLVARAKRMGVPPEDYARQLVEEGLAFQREAEGKSFADIMGPVRKAAGSVNEAEIVKLVEKARADHHHGAGRRRRG